MPDKKENSEITSIKTINEYFDWLKEITHEEGNWGGIQNVGIHTPLMNFFFRGQACCDWKIESSVLRDSYKNDAFLENRILTKAELRLSRELSVYSTYLEKLTYLQHYGLRTRLLDITFNPLVALYVACEKSIQKNDQDKEMDGVVLAGKWNVVNNNPIAELAAEFVFKYSANNIESDITTFAKENQVELMSFTKPLFIYPAINNPRIEHQQGAFIMSPLITIGDEKEIIRYTDSLDDANVFGDRRAIIPASLKEDFLYYLHILGIDEGSLFQDTTARLHTIMQEEGWRKTHLKIYDIRHAS